MKKEDSITNLERQDDYLLDMLEDYTVQKQIPVKAVFGKSCTVARIKDVILDTLCLYENIHEIIPGNNPDTFFIYVSGKPQIPRNRTELPEDLNAWATEQANTIYALKNGISGHYTYKPEIKAETFKPSLLPLKGNDGKGYIGFILSALYRKYRIVKNPHVVKTKGVNDKEYFYLSSNVSYLTNKGYGNKPLGPELEKKVSEVAARLYDELQKSHRKECKESTKLNRKKGRRI